MKERLFGDIEVVSIPYVFGVKVLKSPAYIFI